MSVSNCSPGISPASELFVAFTITMTLIATSSFSFKVDVSSHSPSA
jgi:hypothetical protein